MTLAEVGIVIACAAWERAEGRKPINIRISDNGARISFAGDIDGCLSCVPTQIHFAVRAGSADEVYQAADRIARELHLKNWDRFDGRALADIPIV